jgi:hypothetical protein
MLSNRSQQKLLLTYAAGESTSSTSQPKPKHGPVQLACISCRTRHLKCDARVPVCGRCQTEAHECHYVRSRRGYKGPRRVKRAPNEEGNDGASGPREMGNIIPIDLDTGASCNSSSHPSKPISNLHKTSIKRPCSQPPKQQEPHPPHTTRSSPQRHAPSSPQTHSITSSPSPQTTRPTNPSSSSHPPQHPPPQP